jgi:hypothetical protein
VFEAETSQSTQTPATAIWARWINPARWPEWDPRVKSAEAEESDGKLEVGTQIKVRLAKGGTVRQHVVALEDGHRLVTEYALPGGRVGHEHVVSVRGPGSQVSHRLYVAGPLGGMWAVMLGRKKLQKAVTAFTDTIPPSR